MSTAEILKRAQQALLTRGWTQGTYRNDHGEMCIVGALINVRETTMTDCCRVSTFLASVIGSRSVSEWNDAPGRTPEEVLALFDRAIARAHQEEAAAMQTVVEVA